MKQKKTHFIVIIISLPGFSRLRMHTKCTTSQIAPSTTTTVITTTTTANAPSIVANIQGITNGHAAPPSSTINPAPAQQAHIQNIPVAFVEFKDIASAGNAMVTLQGKFLLSSDRPIRIEFAKSKMVANTVDNNIINCNPNHINSTPIKHHTALLLREVCYYITTFTTYILSTHLKFLFLKVTFKINIYYNNIISYV